MIDREARNRFAELLRHFAAGLMKSNKFDAKAVEIACNTRDVGVERVFWEGAWGLYDDLWPHRLRGRKRLSRDDRRFVARMILFLHSDLEYEWPAEDGWWMHTGESRVGCLGWFAGVCGCRLPDPPKMSEDLRNSLNVYDAVWPFRRMADLEAARRHPRLLAG